MSQPSHPKRLKLCRTPRAPPRAIHCVSGMLVARLHQQMDIAPLIVWRVAILDWFKFLPPVLARQVRVVAPLMSIHHRERESSDADLGEIFLPTESSGSTA